MPASSPRARWAERIRAASRKTVESIIRTGSLLIEAKAKLKHGEFVAMVQHDLPFGKRTAQRLMVIGRSPALSKASNWTLLPAHLATLHDLAKLPAKTVNVKIASGEIKSRHDAASNRNLAHAAGNKRGTERGNSRGDLARQQEPGCRSSVGPSQDQFRPG
jgi:hypothetical protein